MHEDDRLIGAGARQRQRRGDRQRLGRERERLPRAGASVHGPQRYPFKRESRLACQPRIAVRRRRHRGRGLIVALVAGVGHPQGLAAAVGREHEIAAVERALRQRGVRHDAHLDARPAPGTHGDRRHGPTVLLERHGRGARLDGLRAHAAHRGRRVGVGERVGHGTRDRRWRSSACGAAHRDRCCRRATAWPG